MIAALRLLLLLAYLPLAHAAGSAQSPLLAAIAVGSVVVMVMLEALFRLRPGAWLLLAAIGVGLWLLARSPYALIPLLLMPVAWVGLIAWWFGRSLAGGRTPLITRLVTALYAQSGDSLSPGHLRYTRRLTLLWALLLGALATVNLALALIAVPGGVLDQLGQPPALRVTPEQWSLVANFAGYGLIGGFMVVEYQVRRFVFPVRPYRNFREFAQRMAALGPGFWRDFLR